MSPHVPFPFLFAVVLASLAYSVLALVLVLTHRGARKPAGAFTPAVTLLKPLCGDEPGLLECLRSFCEQDYPGYQIVFGVRVAGDPAVAVIERLRQEYPDRDLTLIVDGRTHGFNRKMSNLANMLAAARHEILVISDSDVRVGKSYLRTVVAPFQSPRVGAVTCLYTGAAGGGTASVLGAMFINDWFLPAVLVSAVLSRLNFCFGQTMAVRRDALDALGGFPGLAPYLADDYMLGKLATDHGFEVRLVEAGVENVFSDASLVPILRRELRWSRTYRTLRPMGYAFSFLTDTTALSLLYLLMSGGSGPALSLFAATVAVRLGLHAAVRRRFQAAGNGAFWLVPVRDLLCFAIRVASFLSRRVEWKGETFVVQASGRLAPRGETL